MSSHCERRRGVTSSAVAPRRNYDLIFTRR